MTTKWRTGGFRDPIEKVVVIKETDKTLLIEEVWCGKKTQSRQLKSSRSYEFHDTWEAAHAFVLEKAERAVESARLNLERAKGKLGNIKGMKKPADVGEEK